MRESAREIFRFALQEASITKAFGRHVHCKRGVLRVREDLYELQSYSRVLVVSIGKAGHTMAEALAHPVTEQERSTIEAAVAGIVPEEAEP